MKRRLKDMVSEDRDLIQALGDYADQTADLEASLAALRDLEEDRETAPPAPNSPAEQALLSLARALNPAAPGLDPLGAGLQAGPTSLMGRGADAFFENAGGFVPGGGILPTVKGWLMPDTEFRSVYATSPDNGTGMTLCAQRLPNTRNKIAYVWAYRFTNADPPPVSVGNVETPGIPGPLPVDVPIGAKARIPLTVPEPGDWALIGRVYDWALVDSSGRALPVRGRALPGERMLQLDLRDFAGLPGMYSLQGEWDWGTYRVAGDLALARLEDLSTTQLTPESAAALVKDRPAVDLVLTGPNLRFITRAWMHRPDSAREIPVYISPKRFDDPGKLQVEVDTEDLRAGPYRLVLEQVDGTTAEIDVNIKDEPPVVDPFDEPVSMPVGGDKKTLTLTGSGLDRIREVSAQGATIVLKPASADGTRRQAEIQLAPDVKVGDHLDLLADIADSDNPVLIPRAVEVLGSAPFITAVHTVLPADEELSVKLGGEEIPGGLQVSVRVSYENVDSPVEAVYFCAGESRTPVSPRMPSTTYDKPEGPVLVSVIDPGRVGRDGCELQVALTTLKVGSSEPALVGIVKVVPQLASLSISDTKRGAGFQAELAGWRLESIKQVGWSPTEGNPVEELPRPIAGAQPGDQAGERLTVTLPWPSPTPKAPLYVWLEGDAEGRATTLTQ